MGKLLTRLTRDLTLYVRQLAWLNAKPKPAEGTKRAKLARKANTLSRGDQLKRDKIPLQMPPNPAPELIARLVEIGLSEAQGMGSAPLSWGELQAWQELTGIALPPWEARLYRCLSTAYLAESNRAESENCPPPWRGEVTMRERELEEARLEAL